MKRSNKKKSNNQKGAFAQGSENPPGVSQLIAYGRLATGLQGLMRIPRALCPNSVRVVLKFSSNVSMTSTSGAIVTHQLLGNGLFNPDSGAGQPLGFDQWCPGFYTRFRALASTFEVSLANVGATNPAANGDIVVYPSLHGSALTNIQAAASQPFMVRRSGNFAYNMNSGKPLRSHMSTALLYGVNEEAVLADDQFSGTSAADPTRLWYWYAAYESADATTTSIVYAEYTISYLVDFYASDIALQSVPSPSRRMIYSANTSAFDRKVDSAGASFSDVPTLSSSVTAQVLELLQKKKKQD
jgi:hypothetical protein